MKLNSLSKHLHEHHHTSPVGSHMKVKVHDHQFGSKQVNIPHQEANWFTQDIAEALFIHVHNPNLNQDWGIFTLPTIYGGVIKSCDLGSSQGHMTSQNQRCGTTTLKKASRCMVESSAHGKLSNILL